MRSALAVLFWCFAALPAWAAGRDYCPARPGVGTPACTIEPGRLSVEVGLADWQRDKSQGERTDSLLFADTLVRLGLTETTELQLGWAPYGEIRTRDAATRAVSHVDGVSDVLVGFKANLRHPDGSGLSIAVQPFATLPVGHGPLTPGDWGAGVVGAVTYDLTDRLNVQFTPEIDAAVDADGRGRHLAYSASAGLGLSLSDAVSATLEAQAQRDEDPAGHATQLLGALSCAWTPTADLQLDIGGSVGLNHEAPDTELYVGVSRRF